MGDESPPVRRGTIIKAPQGLGDSFDRLRIHRQSRGSVVSEVENVKEGFMVKKGHLRHNWKKRWFVLRGHNLFYFRQTKDTNTRGNIYLVGATVTRIRHRQKPYVFRIQTSNGVDFMFHASSESELEDWIVAVEKATHIDGNLIKPYVGPGMDGSVDSADAGGACNLDEDDECEASEISRNSFLEMAFGNDDDDITGEGDGCFDDDEEVEAMPSEATAEALPDASDDESVSGVKQTASTMPCILSGFLVKKGRRRLHNWKMRWFVLGDRSLSYFKTSLDASPLANVALVDCFVEEVQHHRQFVFAVSLPDASQLMLQAATSEELSQWIDAIGEVCRLATEDAQKQRLVGTPRTSMDAKAVVGHVEAVTPPVTLPPPVFVPDEVPAPCPPLPGHADLVEAMKDPDAGIPLSTRQYRLKTCKLSFAASEMIDWLLSWSFITARDSGVAIGRLLEHEGFISAASHKRQLFDDGPFYYRFARRESKGKQSSGEESDDDPLVQSSGSVSVYNHRLRADSDSIAGFLQKKGHMRHNWKVRWFVLGQRTLEYFANDKSTESIGVISLAGAAVIPRSDSKWQFAFSVTTGSESSRKEYMLRASSADEMDKWVTALQLRAADAIDRPLIATLSGI